MTAIRGHLKDQFKLAAPLCIGHIGQQFIGVVDAAMLGRYSEAALAGTGVANGIYFTITVLGIGLVMGLETLIPQALGAGEKLRARRLFWSGTRVAIWVGAVLSLVAVPSHALLSVTGIGPEITEEATAYLLARIPAMIPMLVLVAGRSYLQSASITRPLIVAMVVANVVNVIANGLLIFGDGGLVAVGLPAIGLPPLGVVGAGLASTAVTVAALVVVAMAVSSVRVEGNGRTKDSAMIRRVLTIGLPVGFQLLAEVGVFAITGILAGRLGTTPAAAHSIALTLASLSFSIAMGLGASTSVLTGQAIGAGDHRRARQVGLAGAALAAAIMGTTGVVFMLAPQHLARLLTDDPDVVAASIPLIRIAAVFQFSDATQAVMAGALRGIGDTKAAFIANLIGHYTVGLPIAVTLAFGVALGAPGLWWGLSAGLTTVACGLAIRFIRKTARPIERS